MANYVQTLLSKTARFYETHMWTQGEFARNMEGEARSPLAPDACKWCLWAALWAVDASYKQVGSDRVDKALNALQACLTGENPHTWNDAPERTKEQVIALLCEAARRE